MWRPLPSSRRHEVSRFFTKSHPHHRCRSDEDGKRAARTAAWCRPADSRHRGRARRERRAARHNLGTFELTERYAPVRVRVCQKPGLRRGMKTYTLKPQDIERRWWLVDAAGQPLGRLASRVAQILRGKHKPTFTPHVNGGDFVIVINAEKVQLRSEERRVGKECRTRWWTEHDRKENRRLEGS